MTCVRMYRHRSRLLSLSSFETLRLRHLPILIFLALATPLTVLACDGRTGLECHELAQAANLADQAERRDPPRDESLSARSQWTKARGRSLPQTEGTDQVKVRIDDSVKFRRQLSVGGDGKNRDGSQWARRRRRDSVESEGSDQVQVAIDDLVKFERQLSAVGDGKIRDGSQRTRRGGRTLRGTKDSDQVKAGAKEDTERSERRMLSATENPRGSNDIADNFANWTDAANYGETPVQRGAGRISDREEFEVERSISIGNTKNISESTGEESTDGSSGRRGDEVEFDKASGGKRDSHAEGCKNGVCEVYSTKGRFAKPETETDSKGSEGMEGNLPRTVISSTSPAVNITSDDEYDKDDKDREDEEDLEDDEDVTFTGFDGSQKFPISIRIQPTQRSPAQQPEKMDRRHFGPPKVDLQETSTVLVLTVLPDLPMSPSRDVLPHRRKAGNSSDPVDGERSKEDPDNPDNPDRANVTSDESWLPGMSPGQRTSGGSKAGTGKNRLLTFSATDSTPTVSERTPASLSTDDNNQPTHGIIRPTGMALIPKVNITILGLFEMTRNGKARSAGPSELQAARLAVDRINEMNILPWSRLQLIHNDTKCDPGVAVDRFFHALYSKNNSPMPLLLGSMCSEVTETLAKIVPYWNIIQVSFGSTAPALSDSTEFPLFLRTVAPDSSHNVARIALLKHFGWDTVTALSQTGDMYSLAVNDLVTELEQANITCTATITFAENDYKEQLQTLKDLDTRIIIGSFSPRLAARVFCEAWKLGMHGGDYAWILPGDTIDLTWSVNDWWHSGTEECLPSQLSQTMNGLIIVKSHGAVFGDTVSSSGLTDSMFTAELAKRGVTHSKFAGQTYDAVWAMALALARTEILLNKKNMSVLQYTHTRKDIAYELLDQMKLLQFSGISGPVSFNGADRVGITAFYQMHGNHIRFKDNSVQVTPRGGGCNW